MKKLKLYMGYSRTVGSNEAAVLIFAHDSKEARKVGWPDMKFLNDTAWTDMETRWLRKNIDQLSRNADQKKLAAGESHCVVDVMVCPNCELWGEEGPREDGSCGYCEDD